MATSTNQVTERSGLESRSACPVAATTKLPQGTLAFISSTGYLTTGIATGANKLAGVMTQEADNSAGADGDIDGEYHTEGVFTLSGSGFTQADVGKDAYASDNNTVTLTSASMTKIGTIREVLSATSVRVALNRWA